MGFLKKIKRSWDIGKYEHHFIQNNKRISYNLHLLGKGDISYSKFTSNVSYLFSEQIKYQFFFDMTEDQINHTSMKLGFWLLLYIYVDKYQLKETSDIESFEDFFSHNKRDFLTDFTNNNPTIRDDYHLQKLINTYYQNYKKNPIHIFKRSPTKETIKSHTVIKDPLINELQSFLFDDFGYRTYTQESTKSFTDLIRLLLNNIDDMIIQRDHQY